MKNPLILSGLLLVCLALLSGGCTATKYTLRAESTWKNGVTPVTVPTKYRYAPCKGEYRYESTDNLSGTTKTEIMFLKYSVMEVQQRLIWHTFLHKLSCKGKMYQPALPVFDFTADSDSKGSIGELSFTSPLAESLSGEAKERILAEIDRINISASQFSGELPEQGITTGDPIRVITFVAPPEGFSVDKDSTNLVLLGEFTLNGTTYVSTQMNDTFALIDNNFGKIGDMKVKGFCIMKKETMETEYGRVDIKVIDYDNGKQNSVKIEIEKIS